jgi:hypothetical protein
MSKAQTLKSIVKRGGAEKPSFGTNPWDPWSAKANIAEDAALDQYLTSRGINPKHVSKDQKVAHSKMGQFIKWKRDHMSEAVDRKDTIIFDIPLLIRVLEFAREELKSDVLLHKMVERLISIRGKGTLTMNQYGKIIKEEAESLGESFPEYGERANKLLKRSHELYDKSRSEPDASKKKEMASKSTRAHGIFMKAKEKHLSRHPEDAESLRNKTMSGASKDYTSGKRWTDDSVEHSDDTNVISEISSETLQSYKDKAMKSSDDLASKGQYKKSNDRLLNHMKATGKQIDKTTASIKKSLNKENTQDPMAASSMPNDGANSPDDVEQPKNKKLIQMSKSARIIKSIYKRKGMKEEIYDHEKEDKSVATYGKKPKMQSVSTDLEEPQAAAVLTGGTTLTGEKRDTIEIDPMLKMRKPVSGKR